jgi:hypothetical protein
MQADIVRAYDAFITFYDQHAAGLRFDPGLAVSRYQDDLPRIRAKTIQAAVTEFNRQIFAPTLVEHIALEATMLEVAVELGVPLERFLERLAEKVRQEPASN